MAPNKLLASFKEAVADVPDGSVFMIGGFGGPGGMPSNLLLVLRDQGGRTSLSLAIQPDFRASAVERPRKSSTPVSSSLRGRSGRSTHPTRATLGSHGQRVSEDLASQHHRA